eukprot:TRINITY_DN8219_c0_g1_i1.p1 TRINITY_DN8219_c0_g1~~TRINITY_DN8219_c0_g1_i1.p1  ORF type:complete len:499 (-),score=73.65 TRINITY_DN8219_c0_g1_i1:45-1514(-)
MENDEPVMDSSSVMMLSTIYSMYELEDEDDSLSIAEEQEYSSTLDPGVFVSLPPCLLECIFSYLSLSELSSVTRTCHHIYGPGHCPFLWYKFFQEIYDPSLEWIPSLDWRSQMRTHHIALRQQITLNRLIHTETLILSIKLYSSHNRGAIIIPRVNIDDGKFFLSSLDVHSLPFPPHIIKKIEFGLSSRYQRSLISPIYTFEFNKQAIFSSTTLTYENGDSISFTVGKKEIEFSKISIKCGSGGWEAALEVLKKTLELKRERLGVLTLSMQILEYLCKDLEGVEDDTSTKSDDDGTYQPHDGPTEGLRTKLIEISRSLFTVSKEEVALFLALCDNPDQEKLRDICRKCVGIVFQKPKLPSWPQTRAIFARDDFFQQFFYFTTMLDDNCKNLKNVTKNSKICEFLDIPSLYHKSDKIVQIVQSYGEEGLHAGEREEKGTHTLASRLVVSWNQVFREYLALWNKQRGDVMMAMVEQECETIEDAIEYLEQL